MIKISFTDVPSRALALVGGIQSSTFLGLSSSPVLVFRNNLAGMGTAACLGPVAASMIGTLLAYCSIHTHIKPKTILAKYSCYTPDCTSLHVVPISFESRHSWMTSWFLFQVNQSAVEIS